MMRLICFWCALLVVMMSIQCDCYYFPQTFKQTHYFKPKLDYLFSKAEIPDTVAKHGLNLYGLLTKIPSEKNYGTTPRKAITPVLFRPDNHRENHGPAAENRVQEISKEKKAVKPNRCPCQAPQENRHCDSCRQVVKKIPVKLTATIDPHSSKIIIPRLQKTKDKHKAPRYNTHELFAPARKDAGPAAAAASESWRGSQSVKEPWRDRDGGVQNQENIIPKAAPWAPPFVASKEQQANILHHKQSLTSEGAFRFEYASDNGLAAGEHIEPDGSRVGAYQYKDPSGQVVQLKYRAGKEGFQIIEGSHLPKSPEPVAPPTGDPYYQNAYQQQKEQYTLQQQFNQQKPVPQQQVSNWGQNQGPENANNFKGGNYFVNSWNSDGDDGQYRENNVDPNKPHTFGEGFAFAFQG